jgi:hydroxymethyl cephem carbamoyltransferase
MLVMALKPGHDGSIAVVRDRRLIVSLEAEKDSNSRYSRISPTTFLDLAQQLDEPPDVVALGGWSSEWTLPDRRVGGGYHGVAPPTLSPARFFGRSVRSFASTHERSHLMMALGMAPPERHREQAVLIWEGRTGLLITVNDKFDVTRRIEVLSDPGGRYAAVLAIADPTFPDFGAGPRLNDAGKVMALAAYGAPDCDDPDVLDVVDRILKTETLERVPKGDFGGTALYNAGVDSAVTKNVAAVIGERIFQIFAQAATTYLPPGLPLRISGGCGLNCDWNARWRESGHFSSVFVPPCTNDSGSAIGTAADAIMTLTGDPHIEWDVYCGLDFSVDAVPDPDTWARTERDDQRIAGALAARNVVAWVQGRWEIGPRALGNRSILAAPFSVATRDRLNQIKLREGYRPIAPCCRIEDVGDFFDGNFADPYMLYFRRVRSTRLQAVTHVDGSARAQTVSRASNRPLHDLLTAFAALTGAGVLCNTSLNFSGFGFINRMSDLIAFCERRGIDDMVVGDTWYQRRRPTGS